MSRKWSQIILFFSVFLSLPTLSHVQASETDSYTFSNIPLRDAAPVINQKINESIKHLLILSMARSEVKDRQMTDAEWEHSFAVQYDLSREGFWTSVFEICIQSNRCPGWGPVDRIALEKGKSIYAQTHFSRATEDFIAPVINLCGVRLGADKLTHFFEDGFRFYDLWMSQSAHLSDQDLIAMSLQEENHMMGKNFTGVVSFGDIYANLAGVRFFRDLFVNGRLLGRDSAGNLFLRKEIDICDYIRPELDERLSRTEFFGDQAQAIVELIGKKKSHPDPIAPLHAQEILCREGDTEIPLARFYEGALIALMHPVLSYEMNSHFRSGVVELSDRRPVRLSSSLNKSEAYPEAETYNFFQTCQAAGQSPHYCGCALGAMRARLGFTAFQAFDRRSMDGSLTAEDRQHLLFVRGQCQRPLGPH